MAIPQTRTRHEREKRLEWIEAVLSRFHLLEWILKNISHGIELGGKYIPIVPGVASLTAVQPSLFFIVAMFAAGYIVGAFVTRLEHRRQRPPIVAALRVRKPKPQHPRPTCAARVAARKSNSVSARSSPLRRTRRVKKKPKEEC